MTDSQPKFGGDRERRIVIDCPICSRTIWNGAICHHGKVSTETPAPKEMSRKELERMRKEREARGSKS